MLRRLGATVDETQHPHGALMEFPLRELTVTETGIDPIDLTKWLNHGGGDISVHVTHGSGDKVYAAIPDDVDSGLLEYAPEHCDATLPMMTVVAPWPSRYRLYTATGETATVYVRVIAIGGGWRRS